jgi:hypothetical protein
MTPCKPVNMLKYFYKNLQLSYSSNETSSLFTFVVKISSLTAPCLTGYFTQTPTKMAAYVSGGCNNYRVHGMDRGVTWLTVNTCGHTGEEIERERTAGCCNVSRYKRDYCYTCY